MADHWALGDIAECIDDDWNANAAQAIQFPKRGQRFMVASVGIAYFDDRPITFIALIEIGSRYRFEASRFRKIKPKGEDRRVPRREAVPA